MFLVSMAVAFTLTSCVSTAYAQNDDVYEGTVNYEVDNTLIITVGTPTFDVYGSIIYYFYDGWYYYPYYYRNGYLFHRYRMILPNDYYHRWYRPLPSDFHRHRPYMGHRPTHRPTHKPQVHHPQHNHNGMVRPHVDNHNRITPHSNRHNRPTPNINRGGNINRGSNMGRGGNMRPMTQPRSSTRSGHMGGRR